MKHLEVDTNAEKLFKVGVARSDPLIARNQKIFRLSVTNFRTKKGTDLEYNISPTHLQIKSPKAKGNVGTKKEFFMPQTKPELNVRPKVSAVQTQNAFFPRQGSVRIVKFPATMELNTHRAESQKNTPKADMICIRTAPNAFHKNGYASSYGKPFMKIPIADLYNPPLNKPTKHRTSESPRLGVIEDREEEDQNQFFVNISSENLDDELIESEKMKKTVVTASTMESSTQLTKMKNNSNFSLSTSQNTYVYTETEKGKFNTERDYASPSLSIKQSAKKKDNDAKINSKTAIRFSEAMEKAKIYNDQMIKQYQFDKENEEEEHDFVELCEILQTNIKE